MSRLTPARYLLASVLLLAALVALLAVSSARRTRQELFRQLEERGLALAEAVEVASRGAIRGNALMEEMVARRLLDNARLIDELLLARPLDPAGLAEIREVNRLRRIDLLNHEGRPWVPPSPPARRPMMMGPGMMGPRWGVEPPPRHREMMRFVWGRRWTTPEDDRGAAGSPAPIRDRRFWEGTLFGVAVGARSFPGIIAVHADAAYVLDFRREIGVDRQVEDLGRQAGVDAVGLLGEDLTILAHTDPRRVGTRETDGFLAAALGAPASRLVTRDQHDALEVVRPLALEGGQRGLVQLQLSTAPIRHAWERDLRQAALLALAVLVLGGIGMGLIFLTQSRHLREVRRLEAEVEQRERLAALGNLAAVVGHEVRNPLNAVSMGLQRLREEWTPVEDGAAYARVVELMQGEVRRLNAIVEEFLSLARPLPLRPQPVAPAALLGEVGALVEAEAKARGVRLVVEARADLPVASLDPDLMKQVLLNLVRNALEAMPEGGTLTVAASLAAERLTLAVEDTGQGIPPDLLPRVFEPYVTSKTRGTGLGLAIARRVVEAHGGRIDAESRPGRGSRVVAALPLAGPPDPADAVGSPGRG
jgi:signal transduction histidine kinase